MVETDSDQDASGNDRFAIVENENEPSGVLLDRNDASLVDFRHEALLKGKTVGGEDMERNCAGGLPIGQSVVSAISL